jgi:hypothetical protein
MEKVKYLEDYIGDKKVADIDWRKYKEKDDDLDDATDKPATKEMIEAMGVNPDELFNDEIEDAYDLELKNFQGLPIVIENPAGSIREYEHGSVKMFYPYGYIKSTLGRDGDEIDCFIGNDESAPNVYVIRIGIDDHEDKVMLGFNSEEQARDAFLAHYDDQKALGRIIEMPIDQFKEILEEKGKKGINLTVDSFIHKRKRRC